MFKPVNRFRRRTLAISILALVLVFILWNIPQLAFITYPLRLFVTYVHEAGHGLAALVTGGTFVRFEIFSNGSGVATTAGGSRLLILPAGYLGAALFGALLFYFANSVQSSRFISAALGVLLIVLSLMFGTGSLTALLVGVLFGLLLWLLAWKGSSDFNTLILTTLAIVTGLNAVLDLMGVIQNSGAALGTVQNDASAFSATFAPLVPGWFWGVLWALLAVLMLGLSAYWSLIRPLRK